MLRGRLLAESKRTFVKSLHGNRRTFVEFGYQVKMSDTTKRNVLVASADPIAYPLRDTTRKLGTKTTNELFARVVPVLTPLANWASYLWQIL